jgi:hypothetical protein
VYRANRYRFLFGGEGRRYADTGLGSACREELLKELLIAIRSVHHDLSFLMFIEIFFQSADRVLTSAPFDREIAYEPPPLPVKTGRHQGKRHRAGAYEGTNSDAKFVRATDEFGARIRDSGASSLRDNPHVMALKEWGCERIDFMRLRVLVEYLEGELPNDTIWTEKFNEAPRRFLLFNHEVRDGGGNRRYDRWKR